MATKTIGITQEVYERLRARKRSDESFTDLIDRLLAETEADWRDGFGTLSGTEGDELERLVVEHRDELDAALGDRQRRAVDEMEADGDEAA